MKLFFKTVCFLAFVSVLCVNCKGSGSNTNISLRTLSLTQNGGVKEVKKDLDLLTVEGTGGTFKVYIAKGVRIGELKLKGQNVLVQFYTGSFLDTAPQFDPDGTNLTVRLPDGSLVSK